MIRDDATQRQVEAANPRSSTWLSANAGSGKTRVLTDRVARLLLEEVSPQNILCLTYTKAAAAEMQNRLFKRLGAWAMMEDSALRAELQTLGIDRRIDGPQLAVARTLFARAIETPGGLKIQTIHSFCAGVLRRFPLEAQVSPQFREMEDRDAELLRAEVVDEMLLGDHADVVHKLLAHFTGDDLAKFTGEIAGKRDAFATNAPTDTIMATLDLAPDAQREDALAIAFNGSETATIDALKQAFSGQSATYQKFANELARLDTNYPSWAELETLFRLFLYAGTNKSKSVNFPQSNHGKAVEAMAPIADEVHDWMDRVAAARTHLWAMDAYDRTCALYDFAKVFVAGYEEKKLAMGALDFDDLIRKAKALLIDPLVAQWVLFRLDGGIDHILVDEAQDTSPTQWDVIKQLTQEFASGEGAQPDRERTVFVVGDKKQSIYSFQGADPDAFDQMRDHFDTALKSVNKKLHQTSLDYSFRSAQAVLSVVDATFTGDRAAGMTDGSAHRAFHENMPGRVDLWPVIEKSAAEDTRDWFMPVDEPSATDHTVRMAEQVAEQIKHIIAHETLPVETDTPGVYDRRPITPGDFLILVQRRSELFAEIIRACKAAKLDIAGADRLRVGAELAVKDLAAVLRFLALPEDDLSLAAALRSPLFEWSEQDLFTLAHHRGKAFLWEAMRDGDYPETRKILDDLRGKADFLRPYDLLERILTRHNGRRLLLARLGPEAEDGIDALLSQALAYESTGVPSLTGFLTWMETDDLEVKRQMDSQGDRIRVMTVHGAKGLESPIVILPDTAKRDIQVKQELLPADGHVIWKTPAKSSAPSVAALREAVIEKQARERLRLLYVAMTRAEKWLIVGAAGDVGEGDASWYNIVADGMAQRGDVDACSGELKIRRVAEFDWDTGQQVQIKKNAIIDTITPEFGAVNVPERKNTLSPSDLGGAKVMPGETHDDDTEAALLRGTLIHRLLEYLPMAKADDRKALGLKLVGDQDAALVDDVIGLIGKDALSWIWDDAALAEVDLTADIPGLGRIHGAIDRLLIADQKVTAVDFKSNRIVPKTPSATPSGLQRQMAAYYYALAAIYPDHQIEVGILWTNSASFMVIPEDILHEALKDIATP